MSVAATLLVPVNVRLGALSAEPPVVPTVYDLVTSASDENPPAPVQLKLVALSIISAGTIATGLTYAAFEGKLLPAPAIIRTAASPPTTVTLGGLPLPGPPAPPP